MIVWYIVNAKDYTDINSFYLFACPRVYTFGYSSDQDIVTKYSSGSQKHGVFILSDQSEFFIIDYNSLNGTYVNDEKLLPKIRYQLKENDIIGVGGNKDTKWKAASYIVKKKEIPQETAEPSEYIQTGYRTIKQYMDSDSDDDDDTGYLIMTPTDDKH